MGDIRTTVEYLGELLETDAFKENTIDTAWLDGILASKSVAVTVEPQAAVLNAAVSRVDDRLDTVAALRAMGTVVDPGEQMGELAVGLDLPVQVLVPRRRGVGVDEADDRQPPPLDVRDSRLEVLLGDDDDREARRAAVIAEMESRLATVGEITWRVQP